MTGRTVGTYALRSSLGRGATAEVWAATRAADGAEVAIKLLRADLAADRAATDALLAEATRLASIAHPGVVRVLDAGRDPATGQPYLVMERLDGETLDARLRRAGRLDEGDARRLGAAIADAVAAAHAAGIVHRDLKPANVVLRGGQPVVVDLGIARHLDGQTAVATGRRVGTPAYMAPEQLTGGVIAPCVDVWALGVIVYEAVTGRLPFEGFEGGRCPQLFEVAPRARALAPVSVALDDLLARCLERDPGRRPATMAQVAAALRGEAGGDERITQDAGPVSVPPPSPSPSPPPSPSPSPPPSLAPPPSPSPSRWRGTALAALAVLALAAGVLVATRSSPAASPAADATPTAPAAPAAPAASPPAPPPDAGVAPDATPAPRPPRAEPARPRRPRADKPPRPRQETLD